MTSGVAACQSNAVSRLDDIRGLGAAVLYLYVIGGREVIAGRSGGQEVRRAGRAGRAGRVSGHKNHA